jgi:hypothetical protein
MFAKKTLNLNLLKDLKIFALVLNRYSSKAVEKDDNLPKTIEKKEGDIKTVRYLNNGDDSEEAMNKQIEGQIQKVKFPPLKV